MADNFNNITTEEDIKRWLKYTKDFMSHRKSICFFIGSFLILGILVSLFKTKSYSSSVTFISQVNNSSQVGGNLKGFASLVGVNLGTNGPSSDSDLPVYLYPKLFESPSFRNKLGESKIALNGDLNNVQSLTHIIDNKDLTFGEWLKKYTIGLPSLIFKSDSNEAQSVESVDSLAFETESKLRLHRYLDKNLSLEIDEEDGTVSITARAPKAVFSTQLVVNAQKILQEEIIRFRIAKSKQKYDFLKKQFKRKSEDFKAAQARLATFIDRNSFNTTQLSQIRRMDLQDERNLLYTITSDLEQQLVAQEIKIQEDIPSFTVISEPRVPLRANSRGRLKTLVFFVALGVFLAIAWFILKTGLVYLKYSWNNL